MVVGVSACSIRTNKLREKNRKVIQANISLTHSPNRTYHLQTKLEP